MSETISKKKKKRFCDPAVCDSCIYIGEGDFICDETMEVVVSDWKPTDKFLKCKEES